MKKVSKEKAPRSTKLVPAKKSEPSFKDELFLSGVKTVGAGVCHMMGAKGVLLRRKIVKPLIEDVPISQSCIRERDAGNFLAPRDVSPGTVVICALVKGITHHSGVWLGNGMIAELDGNGNYREVRLKRFISGDEGEPWRTGSFAYAACNVYGKPLGAKKVAACARKFLGETTKYNVDANNCHRFSTACHDDGNAEEVFRLMETFSIGKLVARICAFHKEKEIIWRPIKQTPKRLAQTSKQGRKPLS